VKAASIGWRVVLSIALGAGGVAAQRVPRLAFRIAEHDVFPGSIAFDPATGDFFLSSMAQSRILRIRPGGSHTDFVRYLEPELESSIGLKVDAARRRLWACTGRYVLFGGVERGPPRTGVLMFDLDDGRLLQSWSVEQPSPSHIFNDLAVAEDGSVFATTTLLGRVYHITPGKDQMELVVDSPGMQTNGVTLGPQGRFLFFVSDQAIRRLDLQSGAQIDVEIAGGAGIGTDGLYFQDGSLFAVQPGRGRIVRLNLNEQMDAVVGLSVLGENHPDFEYPTTGVIVRDTLYLVATSFADRSRTRGPGPQHSDVLIQAWPLPAGREGQRRVPTLASGGTALARVEPKPAAGVKVAEAIQYGAGDPGQIFDLYGPEGSPRRRATLLVLNHGSGDKLPLVRWLSGRGYAVLFVNVRSGAAYPEPVRDAFCAVAWVHAHGTEFGLDASRLVAVGHSGGAVLAAHLGTVDDLRRYLKGCPHPEPTGEWLQGVVSVAGLFDYRTEEDYGAPHNAYTPRYFGGTKDEVPEVWAEASPGTWIDGTEPPFLLLHGTSDVMVRPAQSERSSEALRRAGVDVTYLTISGADHNGVLCPEAFRAIEVFVENLMAG
jgi:acetyl esterase/lipase/sugar lactone lactonase YvrE